MPAISVHDISTLPNVPEREPGEAIRSVRSITTAPSGLEGNGFRVRRAFAGVPFEEIDPFIHMDQMGPVDYAPGTPVGTGWHPHRGFETVTYMIDGMMAHRDSEGGGGLLKDGDTQWMTAGSGLLHIETPPDDFVARGGRSHGIQLWVNLPAADKMTTPRYQGIGASEVALLASPDGAALVRIIAGAVAGVRGPGSTHTPIALVHATVQPGGTLVLPWPQEYNALVYGLTGTGTVGAEHRLLEAGQLATFDAGDALEIGGPDADAAQPFDVLILGGLPIREPVVQYGPFVMNTKAEIAEAFADYEAGKFGVIPS